VLTPRRTPSRTPRPLIADACVTPAGSLWLALGGPRTPGGILVSRDCGSTYRELTRQDPRDSDAHHFYGVYALDERHIWACGAQGEDDTAVIWRSTDGGAFWEVLMAGDHERGLEANAMYTQVVFPDVQHGFLVCCGEDMLTTQDGGRSWKPLHIPGASPFGVYFLDRWRGWLISQDSNVRDIPVRTRIFATTDGGRTWHPEHHDFAGLPAIDVAGLRIETDGSALICGPDGMLLHAHIDLQSNNRNTVRWQFARGTIAGDLNFAARSPDGAFWVVGERGALLVSRDNGVSFSHIPTSTRWDLHAIAFVRDPLTGEIGGLAAGDRGTILRFDPNAPDSSLRPATPYNLRIFTAYTRGFIARCMRCSSPYASSSASLAPSYLYDYSRELMSE
jgi:photosystem II stability/assembly factor-like uncharacterized protein